jgi:hypothetical protein
MPFCKGTFSPETVRKLHEDPHGITFLSQPCAVCGKHVVAKNYGGEWVPESHQKPVAHRSGKYAGRKR